MRVWGQVEQAWGEGVSSMRLFHHLLSLSVIITVVCAQSNNNNATTTAAADSLFSSHRSYYFQLFSPVFFCCMGYGAIYFTAGAVAAFAVTADQPHVKIIVLLATTCWGLFCGFLAGVVVFSLVAGAYQALNATMELYESVAWGVGLCVTMQIVSLFRRLYVYV